MKTKTIIIILITIILHACNKKSPTEIYQKTRDNNIIKSAKVINDINTKLLFGESLLYIIDDFLIINEVRPRNNKFIHLFDKNTFEYITSTGDIGKGPKEITRPGRIGLDKKNKNLWLLDHGKQVIWKFELDSVLNNKKYKPSTKVKINNDMFVERFSFLNDSIAIGKGVKVINNHSFEMVMVKLNIKQNKLEKFGYEHPKILGKKSNSLFKLSRENNIYVNCYTECDLITVCKLNGDLKYNIYGPDYSNNEDNNKSYFRGVDITENYIITSYIGDKGIVYNKNKRPTGNLPSKFLIFNLDGTYIKTVDVGIKFTRFCVDKENDRIIAFFNKKNPLGYIDIKELFQ